MQAYRSSTWRSATLSERIPPPTGVVSGPLIATRCARIASSVACGSQLLVAYTRSCWAGAAGRATRPGDGYINPFHAISVSRKPRRCPHAKQTDVGTPASGSDGGGVRALSRNDYGECAPSFHG